MGNRKGWLTYGGIFLFLLILLVYTQWKERRYELVLEPLFSMPADQVEQITISKGNGRVTLVRQDSLWQFSAPDTGRPNGARMVEFLLGVIGGQREDFVTEDSSQYERYNLTVERAVRIEVQGTGGTMSAYFGRSPSDFASEYVRYPGDERTYLVHGSILNNVGTSAAWWRSFRRQP